MQWPKGQVSQLWPEQTWAYIYRGETVHAPGSPCEAEVELREPEGEGWVPRGDTKPEDFVWSSTERGFSFDALLIVLPRKGFDGKC